eukprot:GHVP01064464.1.p1 GENE.GHVP01064464.1~~GHVP01064464.1.p1  ORF type:complete len:121 (-),score=9.35 GHVP01064464.1:148-510(-)
MYHLLFLKFDVVGKLQIHSHEKHPTGFHKARSCSNCFSFLVTVVQSIQRCWIHWALYLERDQPYRFTDLGQVELLIGTETTSGFSSPEFLGSAPAASTASRIFWTGIASRSARITGNCAC